MTETERLARLAAELLSNVGYAEGRRSFPRTVTVDDAIRLMDEIYTEIDRACEERQALARARQRVIACTAGCNHCCELPVTVFRPEAELIAAWLRRDENAATRERFLAAVPAWRERAGDGFAPIVAAIAAGDKAAEEEAHLAQWQRRAMCAFNHEGLCTIYAVRPAVCRSAHALWSNEGCRADRYTGNRADLPSAMTFVPVDGLMAKSRLMTRALHHALGGRRGTPAALCEAVFERLTQP